MNDDLDRERPVRALSLFSGGLDSQLAICVLREQGIHVEAITFESPFFCSANAVAAAASLDVRLHLVDFTDEIMRLLVHAPHGYGQEMNPCIDCHAQMIRKAGGVMGELGFHFLSTGEVLNQRPMSQNRQSLAAVTADSGCAGYLLRPLSARLLDETEPEKRGWVIREKLLALEGRNRKPQYKLARQFGLKHIPQPAGGCKLTEPNFCRRLRDLQANEGLELRLIRLLKLGRHFRVGGRGRLIVGRDEHENAVIAEAAEPGETIIRPEVIPGPTCLLLRSSDDGDVMTAAAICARYSDILSDAAVNIRITGGGQERLENTVPAAKAEIDRMRI